MTNNKVKYVDNTEILNEKRKMNAYQLIENMTKDDIVQDIDDKNHYAVRSNKTGSYYEVMFLNSGKYCSCIDYTMNCDKDGFLCKHIFAILILKEQNKRIVKGVLNL